MAVQSITITQKDFIDYSLLAVHNPLVFFIDVEYTDSEPEAIYVKVYDLNIVTLLNTFYALPYQKNTETNTKFIFIADEILRSFMPTFEDELQGLTFQIMNASNLYVQLTFTDLVIETYIQFNTLHACRQIGETPEMINIASNVNETILGFKDFFTYVYFYSPSPGFTLKNKLSDTGVASAVGYFRTKITKTEIGEYDIDFYVDDFKEATKTLIIKDYCPDQKMLKYLNRDGQYRFLAFNKQYEIKETPVIIGKTDEFITSILTAQRRIQNIGYKNSRIISLTSIDLSESEMEFIKDIFTSPKIYLYVGTNQSDDVISWIEVECKFSNTTFKERKKKFMNFDVDVTLPESYTIKLL